MPIGTPPVLPGFRDLGSGPIQLLGLGHVVVLVGLFDVARVKHAPRIIRAPDWNLSLMLRITQIIRQVQQHELIIPLQIQASGELVKHTTSSRVGAS